MNQIQQSKSKITFKEFILKHKANLSYLWNYRQRLLLMGLLGGILGFGCAHYFIKATYTSRLTFMIEEKTSGMASIMGLASQFGLDLSGGGGGDLFSSDNLMLMLRSQKIIESALLEPLPELNNDHLLNNYLHNHYPKDLQKKKIKLYDLNIQKNAFGRAKDSILAEVVIDIQKSIVVNKLDKKASIIDLTLTDVNEQWAFLMSKLIIKKATDLYLDLKVGKTSRTIGVLESRLDSIKRTLDGLISAAAVENDQSKALVSMQSRVPAAKKQMQIQILSAMQIELVKTLELNKFALQREEPVIQVIDTPIMPLKKTGQKRILTAVLGSFLVTTLVSAWLLAKKWWVEVH